MNTIAEHTVARSIIATHLDHARALLEASDPAGALKPLLAAWRRTRAAAIAAVIDRVSDRLLDETGPIEAPTVRERIARFLERAARRRAVDVGSLVATPWPGTWKAALPLLEALIAFPHDPRIAMALARLMDDAPYDSTASRRFWNPLIEHLAVLEDPRTLPTLERGGSRRLGGYHVRGLDDAICKLRAPRPPLDADAQAALAGVEALFAAAIASEAVHAKTEGEFLDAIYMDPHDDGARMVYADWLGERDDPRGELITLQLARHRGHADEAMRRREAALLDEHARTWLGPLDHVVDRRRRVFERGFLARAGVDLEGDELTDELRDPRWATVHTIESGWQRASPEVAIAFLRQPALRFVRSLHKYSVDTIAALADGPPNPQLVEITLLPPAPSDADALRRIGDTVAFPNLERLGFHGDLAGFAALLDGALARRVAQLSLHHFEVPLGPLARLVEARPVAASAVCVVFDDWVFALRRDESGRFTRLHIAHEADTELPYAGPIERVLDSIGPHDLTELTVEARPAGYRARTIRALEARLQRFERLATVAVPWERQPATSGAVPVKLVLRGTGATDAARLRALWSLVAEPPLELAFDAYALNQEGPHRLEADGLAHATALLARRGAKQLELYRTAASDTCLVELREDAVRITSVADGGDDFVERYVGWLARVVNAIGCASAEVAFAPLYGEYSSLAPFDRMRRWMWLLEPDFDRIVPFAELVKIAAEPEFAWLRAIPVGRYLALVFGPSPDRPPAPAALIAFDERVRVLWRERGSPRSGDVKGVW